MKGKDKHKTMQLPLGYLLIFAGIPTPLFTVASMLPVAVLWTNSRKKPSSLKRSSSDLTSPWFGVCRRGKNTRKLYGLQDFAQILLLSFSAMYTHVYKFICYTNQRKYHKATWIDAWEGIKNRHIPRRKLHSVCGMRALINSTQVCSMQFLLLWLCEYIYGI